MAKTNIGEKRNFFSKEGFANVFNRENIAKAIFIAFAAFSILAVFAIVFFILYQSIPVFQEIGFFKFVFSSVWKPSADEYGVLPMIVTSIVLTVLSVVIGGVLAVFTAVFMVYYCPTWLKKIYSQVINLLAGIPSIVFGYFGLKLLKPLLQDMFVVRSAYGLLLSTIVLSIMILPTIASIAKNSLESVPMQYYEGSLALGNTKNQTVFKVMLPAARNGIVAGMILGIGRAVGETMAVQFLLGGSVSYPISFFLPIRSLTSNIVQEFGYAEGLHKQALIATGFILLLFILIINLCLWFVKKNNAVAGNSFFTRKIKEGETEKYHDYKKTGTVQDVLWIISYIVAAFVAAMLVTVVLYILIKGLPNLSWHFLFGKSTNANVTLAPAFVTTGYIILISLVIALPLGIGAAIFLNEYAKRGSKFVKVVRLFIDTLAGVPSILFGLFGAIFFGSVLDMGYSILGGSLTMVLMILPTIIRSTEQSLSEVPDSMREASLALGAGKLRTIFLVVLPQALPGIITAIILSMGRIIGESAALIFTAGSSVKMPKSVMSQGSTFAVLMYNFMSEGLSSKVPLAYATGAVLIILVLILNIAVTLVERFFNNKSASKKGNIRKFIDKLRKKEVENAEN